MREIHDMVIERRRLRAEVQRLRAAIEEHRRTVKPGDDYCGADVILWRAIDA